MSSLTSVDLSILSFCLSSWLEGSSELRRALIFFPLGITTLQRARQNVPTNSEDNSTFGSQRAEYLVNRYLAWFRRPKRELDDVERMLMGGMDVMTAILLLRLLSTGPILSLLFDPFAVIMALRKRISKNSVRWRQVVAASLALSTLHEAQRVSASTLVTWWRDRQLTVFDPEDEELGLKDIVIRGDSRISSNSHLRTGDDDDDSEDNDECIICAGEGTDDALSSSISSLSSSSSSSLTTPGPLEAFCTTAPQKHLMHRGCFLSWKNACWEERFDRVAFPLNSARPLIVLACENASTNVDDAEGQEGDRRLSIPVPGTAQWKRSLVILRESKLIKQLHDFSDVVAPVDLDDWPTGSRRAMPSGQSVFVLHDDSRRGGTLEKGADVLATMFSKIPPCPGCRSVVKMAFAQAPPAPPPLAAPAPHQPTCVLSQFGFDTKELIKRYPTLQWVGRWCDAWKELVTGRTILARTVTQITFVVLLVSAMRMKRQPASVMLRQ